MNAMAWAWMSGGAPKLERPSANWSEKPAAMVTAMAMAPPRKKPRSSRPAKDGIGPAIATMAIPPETQCYDSAIWSVTDLAAFDEAGMGPCFPLRWARQMAGNREGTTDERVQG